VGITRLGDWQAVLTTVVLWDQSATIMTLSFRSAGRAGIASGIIGILVFVILISAVFVRNAQGMVAAAVLFRAQQAGNIVQLILLIPLTTAICRLSRGISPGIRATGVAALCLTVLLVLLAIPRIVTDPMYMFTEGVFGVWLIFICRRMADALPRGLQWFGIVVGIGLALVGLFPVGYAIFVSRVILQIPAPPDAVIEKIQITPANNFIHYLLFAGTFLGIITLPFWTILVGRRLLREKSR
jgi:hypothetical protein